MENTVEELKRFSAIMLGVAEDFGGKISPEGLRVKFEALREYSIDQISQAGTWLLKNREERFPAVPTTKEFIDTIKGQGGCIQISAGSRAEIQADVVIKKLRQHGRNAVVDFEDPITFQLMTGRWRYNSWAADVIDSELKWWRKEFVEAYKAYSEAGKAENLLPPPNTGDIKRLQSLALGALRLIK